MKGVDQYGAEYSLENTTMTWASDNTDAFVFDAQKGIITAVNPSTSAGITVSAENEINKEVKSNVLTLSVPRVRKLTSITLEDAPEAIPFGTTLDLNTLKVTCFDELKEAYTKEELEAYPAWVAFALDKGDTEARLDTSKNILTAGQKYGYVTISAMTVNSSTTNAMTDPEGNEIATSVKVWVGPKVSEVLATPKMNADAGKNTITLNGLCLEDNMKVGLFDEKGNMVAEGLTVGTSESQSAVLDIPSNIGGASDVTYTVKYAITDQYIDSPTTTVAVSNKIPSTSISLNKDKMVLEPGTSEKLDVKVEASNSTDKITWTSSNPAIATVDENGTVKAVAPGQTDIQAKAESGATAICRVTVGLRKGDVFSSGLYEYRVTDSKVDGTGTIGVVGFAKGKYTSAVKIPKSASWSGIAYKVTSIERKAFMNNKRIKTCVIPDTVVTIRSYAFYQCSKMTGLTIGKKVQEIGKHAFCQDTKLKKIVIKSKVLKTLGTPHAFVKVNKAKVYVPKTKYKKYKKELSRIGLGKCQFKKL